MGGAWERFRDRTGGLMVSVSKWYASEPVEPVKTGIAPLDAALAGGMQPRPYFIGGKPASGKSALALQIALNVALSGHHVAVWSGEMSRDECERRLLACYSATVGGQSVSLGQIDSQGRMFRARMAQAMREGVDLAGFMANVANGGDPVVTAAAGLERDGPALAIVEGKPRVSAMRQDLAELAQDGVRPLVVLDYLQLLDTEKPARSAVDQASEAVEAVRLMANDYGVPVLALAALGREPMRKKDEGPTMNDFRDTSSVEYAAQGAIILRRADEGAAPGPDGVEVCAHVVKLRNGPFPRVARLMFDGARNHFRPLGR